MTRSRPVLDWRPRHDERSRNFPIRALVGRRVAPPRPVLWDTGVVLDQGQEGACVGFGWTGRSLSGHTGRPSKNTKVKAPQGNQMARTLYDRAKVLDDEAGEDYEGTSVLAGAKALVEAGALTEYRWAFGIEDVRDALAAIGPVVIGVNWYEAMYETTRTGRVVVDGDLVGGHCLFLTGYQPNFMGDGPFYRWRNSWGHSYGMNGTAYISEFDLAALLADDGEACIPVR